MNVCASHHFLHPRKAVLQSVEDCPGTKMIKVGDNDGERTLVNNEHRVERHKRSEGIGPLQYQAILTPSSTRTLVRLVMNRTPHSDIPLPKSRISTSHTPADVIHDAACGVMKSSRHLPIRPFLLDLFLSPLALALFVFVHISRSSILDNVFARMYAHAYTTSRCHLSSTCSTLMTAQYKNRRAGPHAQVVAWVQVPGKSNPPAVVSLSCRFSFTKV